MEAPDGATPLRIGVLFLAMDREAVPVQSLLALLRARTGVELIEVVPRGGAESATADPGLPPSLALYRWLDRRLGPDGGGFPQMRRLTEQQVLEVSAFVSDQELDILACPLPISDPGRLSDKARLGCWWLQIGSGASPSEGYRASFEDLCNGGPLAIRLLALSPSEASPRVVDEATVRISSRVSLERSTVPLRSLALPLWARALNSLAPYRRSDCWETTVRPAPRRRLPLVRLALSHLGHRQSLRNTSERWEVGIRPRDLRNEAYSDPRGYRWLEAPSGRWYADPIPIERDGRTWLFMEEFSDATGRGRLVCGQIDAVGAVGEVHPVLDLPVHLSYPHVFGHGGEVFLIPESGGAGEVTLYRAVDFPFRWEKTALLQRGPYFDTTVHEAADGFWFFTTLLPEPQLLAGQLMLFHADTIDGSWRPHPANPISLDARFSRSAGRLFRSGNRLLRPAQDCSRAYGGAVSFRQVITLDHDCYEESGAGRLDCSSWPQAIGTHTYGRTGSFEIIDRNLRVPSRAARRGDQM
jgi:hypothetical protein